MSFMSDTPAPAHPAILDAVARANHGLAASYGADEVSKQVERRLAELFETDVSAWMVGSGTAANGLAVATFVSSMGAVLCHQEAHIERDERGAVEFFSGGAKLSLLPGAHAKIDLSALETALARIDPGFVHETPAELLSLTNLTESGAAYAAAEIAERAGAAKARGLAVHLDGARFANAIASTGASPADMTWRAGVDVVTFGATKNGALGCDAIVLFGAARKKAPELQARAKRAGHMPAKMRFLAAQMDAHLADGLWLANARRANAAAARLADGFAAVDGVTLAHPADGNEVFAFMPDALAAKLSGAGVAFHKWLDGSQRFVCSWATKDAEIDAALAALRA